MKTDLKLVEIHGQTLTTTSLIIAELFGRTHGNVIKSLEKLKDRIHLASIFYKDSYGRNQILYELDERAFLIAMPFIGGKKSKEGQVKLVDEFLRLQKRLNEPNRLALLKYKRDTHRPMMDMKKALLEQYGIVITNAEYIKENMFCNRALTGKWQKVDEEALDTYDAKLLGEIRSKNVILMATLGTKQEPRKLPMEAFVLAYRAANPKLTLIK